MTDFVQQYYEMLSREVETGVDQRFRNTLCEAGFEFSSHDELATFCKTRLESLSFEDEHPDYRELWLDHGTKNARLICTYWDRTDIDWNFDGEKWVCIMTWGQPPSKSSHNPPAQ